MRRVRVARLAGLLAAGIGLATLGQSAVSEKSWAQDTKPLKIGMLAGLSGVYADLTQGNIEAMQLAIEDVGGKVLGRSIEIAGHAAPFGRDLLFAACGSAAFTFYVEICEDLWVPQPPSTEAALAGAEILLNLSASNITIGKAEMRRLLCASQSSRCIAAYAYSSNQLWRNINIPGLQPRSAYGNAGADQFLALRGGSVVAFDVFVEDLREVRHDGVSA